MRPVIRPFTFGLWVAIATVFLVSTSFTAYAVEGTPEPGDPGLSVPEPEPTATPSPVTVLPTIAPTVDVPPTVVPVVEPTEDVLPEATLAPEPTPPNEVPPPTIAPTASVVASTPTPEPVPTEVAPTPTPEPQPTDVPPTPTPVPNTDTVVTGSSLAQVSLSPGAAHTVAFSYYVTTPRTGTLIAAELRGSDGTPATGWVLTADGMSSNVPAVTLTDGTALDPGTAFQVSLTITAPIEVSSEQSVQLFVRGTGLTSQGDVATPVTGESPLVSVTVVPPLPALLATDFSLGCSPDAVSSGVGDEVGTVSCSFQGLDTLGTRQVTLDEVMITAPSGWDVSGAGSTMALSPDQAIGAGAEYDFSFLVSPLSCDAVSGVIQLSSQVAYDDERAIVGPATSLVATVDIPSPSLPMVDATFLGFSPSKWSREGFPASTGAIAMTITPTGDPACPDPSSEWSLQVSTTGLVNSSHPDQVIPAENITYLGSRSVDGAPEGVMPVMSDVQLTGGQPVTIATGVGTLDTEGTWTAQFQIIPQDNAVPGSYGGSVDVVVVGAP